MESLGRHYRQGYSEQIEVFRVMRDKLTPEQFEGFLLGSMIKYTLRANFNENFDKDIAKAKHYARVLEEVRNEEVQGTQCSSPTAQVITSTARTTMHFSQQDLKNEACLK
jgi:hypothetical protein